MARKLCVGYNEYYKMISMKNIIRAYKNARKGNTRHDSVARYDQMLMLNLGTAYRLLYCGKYEVSPYNEFKVYEPKPRIIKALPFKDRVIQHVLFDYIAPKLEKTFIYDSYANRDGKGTHRGVYREQQFLRKAGKGSYIIKADIHHFFDSIDKITLLNILYKKIKDKKIMKLCEQFIMFDDKPNGIAIGNVTSQLFANVYLNELDHFVKDVLRIKYYVRFMDDFVINCKTKEEAITILAKVRKFLREFLKLELNSKTQIFPEKQGVNFLGALIKYDYLKIRHKTVKRIKRRINKLSKRVKKLNKKYGENSKQASFISKRIYVFYVYQSYASWLGLAKMFYCTSIINKINKKLKELYVTNPKDGKSIMKKILSNPYIPNKVIKDSINIAIWNNLLTANTMEK